MNVLIQGMILASQDYPYIPEEVQQKVIREQMVKDQTYEELNSRAIHKWLNGIAGKYWIENKEPEKAVTPASPEVADYWAEEWKKELAKVGQPVPKVSIAELEDKRDPFLKGMKATPKPEVQTLDPREEKIRTYVIANVVKWKHQTPKQFYMIEGIRVPGDSKEEAQEIYLNAVL